MFFQGSSQTVHYSHTFNGPRDGIFQTTDVVSVTALLWARPAAQLQREHRAARERGLVKPEQEPQLPQDGRHRRQHQNQVQPVLEALLVGFGHSGSIHRVTAI
jgi:hypothetical protein